MTKVSGNSDIERLDLSKKTVKEVVAELARHYEALRAQPGIDRLDTSFSASLANQEPAVTGVDLADQPGTGLPPLRDSFDPLPSDNPQFAADTGQLDFDRRIEPQLRRTGSAEETGGDQASDQEALATERRPGQHDADLAAPVDSFDDVAPPPLAHAAGSSLSAYAAAGHQQQMAGQSDSRKSGFGWGMLTGILVTLILAAATIWLIKSPLADRFPLLQLLRTSLQSNAVAPSSSVAGPKPTTDTSSQSNGPAAGEPETIALPAKPPASSATAPAPAAEGAPTAAPQPASTLPAPAGLQPQVQPAAPATPAPALPSPSSTTSAKPAAAVTTTKKSSSKTANGKTKSTSPKVATSKKKSTDPLTAKIKPKPFNPADVSTFPTAAGAPAAGASQPTAPNTAPANAAPTSLLPGGSASSSNP